MRRSVRKVFWVWDWDREEAWLNEMAAKGLALVATGYCRYDFEETEPGAYRVAMELLEHRPSDPETAHYLEFMESTGAEAVGFWMRWVYYRKKTSDGSFEVFSDHESRMKHLVRILWLVALVAGGNFYAGVANAVIFWQFRNPINLFGIISFIICGFCCWGIWKMWKKIKQLKDESQIYE